MCSSDLAQGLKKQVIAEWVEDAEALEILVEMGTEYGQGYLFQKPGLLENRLPGEAAAPTSGAL